MRYMIGDLRLKNPFVLAPMAGITDRNFRILCRRYGAGLVYTEMISAEAVIRKQERVLKQLRTVPEEKPIAVQLFGAQAEALVEAARSAEKLGADIIDINIGCPDRKLVRIGAGSALLKRPEIVSEIVKAVVKNVTIPVTVKTRIGTTSANGEGLLVAQAAESAGASAVAIHGRTVKQGYSGKADWQAIKDIKDSLSVPVIGSGDIFSGKDALEVLEKKMCDLVMIGRGAIGNPHIFTEANGELDGKAVRPLSPRDKLGLFQDYLALSDGIKPANFACAKRHALSFTKGIRGGMQLRNTISRATTLHQIINHYNAFLEQHPL